MQALVAQLAERRSHNPKVEGSNPSQSKIFSQLLQINNHNLYLR